ncbi:MAG: membrane protein insertion efficiency factor YidD [Nitrospirales bacterium]
MSKILQKIMRGYQYGISPFVGVCCRFEPTCSHYMVQAIEKHGSVKGLWLGMSRFLKCHPFHSGGLDPVP